MVAAVANEKVWWYLARAGGLTAWWLLAGAVLWGLVLSTRIAKGKVTPAWLLDLHRMLGGLALLFTGLHIGAVVADSWVHFGWADVLVPFASQWRPGATAAGVLGLYLLLAVELTSLAQRKLPRRLWRAVHATSFVLFLSVSLHAVLAGADAGNLGVRISGGLMLVAFTFLLIYRAAAGVGGARPRPTPATASRPQSSPPPEPASRTEAAATTPPR